MGGTLTDLSVAPLTFDPQSSTRPPLEADTLRRHIQVYLDLITQPALILGDVDEVVRQVDEAAAQVLDVARVSVWLLDTARTRITSRDLYERDTRRHSAGVELMAEDYGAYFDALQHERTIAAHDAHHDPRTSCFSSTYLTPLGIGAMLDVPIWAGTRMVGVICHEHVGPARTWSVDEERFARLMAHCVALSLERAQEPIP